MKKCNQITSFMYCITILLLTISCNFGTKENGNGVKDNSESTAKTTENSNVYMNADSWRSWTPPQRLSSYSLRRFVADPFKLNGLNSASVRYENNQQWLTVNIIDGSSDKGKREIKDHLAIENNLVDFSSEFGYEKTVKHEEVTAKEEYLAPPAGQYLIKFMLDDTYGVSVKSNAETAEEVWKLIDQLDLHGIKD